MNEVILNELPEKWEWTKLGDVVTKIIGGGTPSKDNPKYWDGDIPWLTVKDMRSRRPADAMDHISEAAVEESSTNIIPEDTVIIATRIGLGKVIRVPYKAAINQDLKALIVPPGIEKGYLEYWFVSKTSYLESIGSGTTVKGIRLEQVRDLDFPLAPPEQQKRIVAKIEELFSHIDAGIEALKKAKQLLKQYRQSVLKAAVTGKLTKEWREANKDKLEPASHLLARILKERRQKWEKHQLEKFRVKGRMPKDEKWKFKYIEPEVIQSNEIGDLPHGWEIIMLSGLCTQIGDVDHKMPKAKKNGIPYISTKDFSNNDGINFQSAKVISQEDYDHLCRKIYPEYGDILLSRYGTVGEVRRVIEKRKFQVSYSIAILKPASSEIGRYLSFALITEPLQRQIKKYTRATAQPDLGLAHIREFEIPLPSKEEQEEIMMIVDGKMGAIVRLDTEIDHALLKEEKHKQSVLASAFSGGLVNG